MLLRSSQRREWPRTNNASCGGMGVRLNVAEHGFSIAVYNRTLSKVDTCLSRAEAELGEAAGNMVGCFSAEEFIASLSRPRKVMFLVTAGP